MQAITSIRRNIGTQSLFQYKSITHVELDLKKLTHLASSLSMLSYEILALFLVVNLALYTGLITVPSMALLTVLHAARYPVSLKTPFTVPVKIGIISGVLELQCPMLMEKEGQR